ncbi:MAG: hypothetical protein IKW62_03320 [Clostridia bacterium]|nr:hypothetical protein [Clostridia bacterium]
MSEELDFSKAIEQVQQMLSSEEGESQIQNLIGMLTGKDSSASDTDAQSSGQSSPSFDQEGLFSNLSDIETIMKIKNIMGVLGNQKNDTNTAFLNSLKPFLKKDRQEKLEQATKLMSIAKAIKLLKDSGIGGV